MNTSIQGDFLIWISVPLTKAVEHECVGHVGMIFENLSRGMSNMGLLKKLSFLHHLKELRNYKRKLFLSPPQKYAETQLAF